MNKVICDVCGTAYPETAAQCPICGCAKEEVAAPAQEPRRYTHVKGGRFSQKNVNKRNKERAVGIKSGSKGNYAPRPVVEDEDDEPSNRGLWIAVIVLLLAIAAVALYIYFHYFAPSTADPDKSTDPISTSQQTQPEDTTPDNTTGPVTISCTGISLTEKEITLNNVGDGYLLNFALEPADTTDAVSYISSNPEIATVNDNGKITAVSSGTVTITITCGNVQAECTVTCAIETEPSTEPSTEPPTLPDVDFELNRADITMFRAGETWSLYNGEIGNTLITWTTSDSSVATVVNGTVTAVGNGMCTIKAEYNGVVEECIVRVNIKTE